MGSFTDTLLIKNTCLAGRDTERTSFTVHKEFPTMDMGPFESCVLKDLDEHHSASSIDEEVFVPEESFT